MIFLSLGLTSYLALSECNGVISFTLNVVTIEEVNVEVEAKKAVLATTDGEKNGKKRKKGDSAVKATKDEDITMEEDSEDEDGFALPGKKETPEETPAKKQAVAGYVLYYQYVVEYD